jgi:hypothetical protein
MLSRSAAGLVITKMSARRAALTRFHSAWSMACTTSLASLLLATSVSCPTRVTASADFFRANPMEAPMRSRPMMVMVCVFIGFYTFDYRVKSEK